MVKVEITEVEVLEKLICRDIPDTRALQQMRMESIGHESRSEQTIEKYYPEKWSVPRVVRMPPEDQKKVYSLLIPLTFGFGEPFQKTDKKPEIYFSRWQSRMCGMGSMHLTTEEALNMILEILVKNNIPIKLEMSYGPIFDVDKQRRLYDPAIAVPFCWHTNDYDPSESLVHHQFAVCKQKVIGTPYYFLEETIVKTEKQERILPDHLGLSLERVHQRDYSCSAVFTSPEHWRDLQPDKLIPSILEERKQGRIDDQNPKYGELESAEIKLLKIGEPVLVYDPAWISEK